MLYCIYPKYLEDAWAVCRPMQRSAKEKYAVITLNIDTPKRLAQLYSYWMVNSYILLPDMSSCMVNGK